MDSVFPSYALHDRLDEVVKAAGEGIVHIVDAGEDPGYVFCSEEVFQRHLAEEAEQALHGAALEEVVTRGRAAFEVGDYIEGTEAAFAETERRRAARMAETAAVPDGSSPSESASL